MKQLVFRKANLSDAECYFKWLNDIEVRKYSFSSNLVSWDEHYFWFEKKLVDPNYCFYIFQIKNQNSVGQVRFQKIDNLNSIIGVSISSEYRGFGYGSQILKMACSKYSLDNPRITISAYIKLENIPSISIFERAGFIFNEQLIYKNSNSALYRYYANR